MNFFLKSLKEHRLQDDVNNKITSHRCYKKFQTIFRIQQREVHVWDERCGNAFTGND